jgi:hypothetical protein
VKEQLPIINAKIVTKSIVINVFMIVALYNNARRK